jgi:hypothetical protein
VQRTGKYTTLTQEYARRRTPRANNTNENVT